MSFQFTHPGKGATISVRATTEIYLCFNSRTLGRVRLTTREVITTLHCVSIHAPWEGCDHICKSHYGDILMFQFTHPGKGATDYEGGDYNVTLRFNSRTLGRVRPYL